MTTCENYFQIDRNHGKASHYPQNTYSKRLWRNDAIWYDQLCRASLSLPFLISLQADRCSPFLSIASQKNSINLYHMWLYADETLLAWFTSEYPKHTKTKLDMGKSCIRWKNPEHIPYDLIGELAGKMTPIQWMELYEKNLEKIDAQNPPLLLPPANIPFSFARHFWFVIDEWNKKSRYEVLFYKNKQKQLGHIHLDEFPYHVWLSIFPLLTDICGNQCWKNPILAWLQKPLRKRSKVLWMPILGRNDTDFGDRIAIPMCSGF